MRCMSLANLVLPWLCVEETILFTSKLCVKEASSCVESSRVISSHLLLPVPCQEVGSVKSVVGAVGALIEVVSVEAEVETGEDSEVEEVETEATSDQEKWIPGKTDFSKSEIVGNE